MTPRTCLVADDHPALRGAVVSFLETEGSVVVGAVGEGRQAVGAAAADRPDLAVVDYRMPRLAEAALVRSLAAASPATRIVVYTAEGDGELARDALDAGAAAVVLKEAPLADLARALESVRRGRTYLDPGLAERTAARPALTGRECEVLELLGAGLGHEEIGERLGISAETVRTHVRKATARLGAATRTQAVATAIRLGLIP